MKKITTLFFFIIVLTVAGLPLVLWWSTLQTSTIANNTPDISEQSINELKQQLISSQISLSGNNKITLTETELNQLISYSLKQFNAQPSNSALPVRAKINLGTNSGTAFFSIETPLPVRPFVNISVDFSFSGNTIEFTHGTLGIIPLDKGELQGIYQWLQPYIKLQGQIEPLLELTKMVQLYESSPKKITVHYQLDKNSVAQLNQSQMSLALGNSVINALPGYLDYLDNEARQLNGRKSSIAHQLPNMFAMAAQHTAAGADSIVENKAIIVALTTHIANNDIITQLNLGESITLPENTVRLTINNRADLAQHFLVSAAITVYASKVVADKASIFQELESSQTTNFDATHLIAGRAGSLFASKLVSRKTAQHFQLRVQAIESEADFFPATQLLSQEIESLILSPTNNPEQVFTLIGSTIDTALDIAPLYRNAR